MNPDRVFDMSDKKWTMIEVEPLITPPRDENLKNNRIVQTKRGELTKEAAKDAFLGERTQVVDRQTVSKNHETQSGKQAVAKVKPAAPQMQQPARSEPLNPPSEIPALKNLGLKIIPDQALSQRERARDAAQDLQNDGVPQDYIKGMREGDATALNTREYMFFGYFQRIRERLDRAWNANLKDKLYKFFYSGRRLATETDHTTKVMVTLDSGGEVTRVQLLEESGTRDLDDAAIRAFNQAGPFPNPPQGILDQAGKIKIRWEFILRT